MNLLAIETSCDFCSLAVSNAQAVHERHLQAGQRHAELALDALDALLREADVELADLAGIAYGEGPGSFTGLRIACSLVQGLGFARGLAVVGIGTLQALAEASGERAVIACLDARMGEVYHAAYRRAGEGWSEACPPGLYRPDAVPALQGSDWSGCGPGFASHAQALGKAYQGQLLQVRPDVAPTAAAVLRLARPRFLRGEGRDAASAVPIYLRDKVALKTSERR
ncbi:MAG: tRNA (adenosine(37)-N6)-threonylcarbamoyltransferase complex dimerization subunit type 1 TsaB [Betaproteobacteria bacterium RIFCSPLOWO2_12_FULL_66_14]|nr:MAG: tRNA (adenosine(37)-N6)-threonylcarbamoyltransferase complex dimerization subunit type 1 TsaB [Betaproteobacteria bacterium RIFCSPLOWO2_12_FULL_66_14]